MTVERVDYLEVLHRICERKGWALCLNLSSPIGGFAQACEQPATLTTLDVIQPTHDRDEPRTTRIRAGELLACEPVGHLSVREAAERCVAQVAPLVEAA